MTISRRGFAGLASASRQIDDLNCEFTIRHGVGW